PVQEDGSAADAALEPGAATRAGGREAGSGSAVEREVIAALAGAALSGFTAMLYELGWIRVLSIVLGASAYAFTLILTAFILGIALGSFWLATRRWDVPPLRAFAWMQGGLVLLPWIGLERCFALGVACNAGAVVLALWPERRRAWVAALPGLALLGV